MSVQMISRMKMTQMAIFGRENARREGLLEQSAQRSMQAATTAR